jgi:hypothetical protein
VNFQNNNIPVLIHIVPLHGIRISILCAMSATWITGDIFVSETLNSHYVTHIFIPFSEHLPHYDRIYASFQHDNKNNSVCCLVFMVTV